jgi:hypothetical protein
MCDLSELDTTFDLDGDEIQRELDEALAKIATDKSLEGLPGMEGGGPLRIDRKEMRQRHQRLGRQLQEAGSKYFRDRGQRPPRIA